MWWRIELKNYRSIEAASVELAPFTVLVGPNGSGKSNFADAIVFARDVGVDASSAIARRGGITGVRRWNRTKPFDVTVDVRAARTQAGLDTDHVRHQFMIHSGSEGAWNFRRELIELQKDGEPQLRLTRRGAFGEFEVGPNATFEMNETASAMLFARQASSLSRRNKALSEVRRFRLNPDAMRQPQLASEVTRLEESGGNIAVALHSIERTQKHAAVLAAMQRIVPGLQNVATEAVGRFLSLKFDQDQPSGTAEFAATEMSEGALRALGIVLAAHQMQKDELLIVEEPEVHIHPGAATVLFEVLKQASEKGAVLVTTHSAELLDAAHDEEILVCDYREGRTRIGPLSKGQREAVREGLFTVSELMRSEPLRIEGDPPAPVDTTSM